MVRLLNSTYSAATNLVQNHVEIIVYYDVFINVFFLNVTFYIYPMSHISHSLSLIMSSLNYVHHMPSYHKCFHASASYVSYAPSCLKFLRALRALMLYPSSRLPAFVPYVPYLPVLSTRFARLIYTPIYLICVP